MLYKCNPYWGAGLGGVIIVGEATNLQSNVDSDSKGALGRLVREERKAAELNLPLRMDRHLKDSKCSKFISFMMPYFARFSDTNSDKAVIIAERKRSSLSDDRESDKLFKARLWRSARI